jgi:hypothetical protein
MMKLLQKKAANAAEELRASQHKLRLSESNNSDLRAASLAALNEIHRLTNQKRANVEVDETHERETQASFRASHP